MDKSEYCSIEWSYKLEKLFPKAKIWWWTFLEGSNAQLITEKRMNIQKSALPNDYTYLPAISVGMLIDKLPVLTAIRKSENTYYIINRNFPAFFNESFLEALCQVIEYLMNEVSPED